VAQARVAALLEANRSRRVEAAQKTGAAKRELQELLVRGYAVEMDVAEMARRAGVSRDTAHRILKGTFEQNQFRM
jgi:DNA-binding IclR family transcriptional regulator